MADEYDITESEDWKEWEQHVLEEMLPKLKVSVLTASIVPDNEGDCKFWVELGCSIMLNKPLILLVDRGRELPEKLRRVADRVIELDFDSEESMENVSRQIAEFIQEMATNSNWELP